MVKMTIGVYKSNKNAGRLRFHRNNTKKVWKHYFLDVDEYEQGEYTFQTEWVSAFKAMILKRSQVYKKIFICLECPSIPVSHGMKLLKDGQVSDWNVTHFPIGKFISLKLS